MDSSGVESQAYIIGRSPWKRHGIAAASCSILVFCWFAFVVQDNSSTTNGDSATSATLDVGKAPKSTIDATIESWESAVERHVFLQPLQRSIASDSHSSPPWKEESDRAWWQSAMSYARLGTHKEQQDNDSRNDTAWWKTLETWLDAHDHRTEDSHVLVYLNHSEAYSWLSPPTANPHVFLVHPDVQRNQAYCGVATTLAVVNSFHFPHNNINDEDEDPIYAPYAYLTDSSVLQSSCVHESVLAVTPTHDPILEPPYGLSLEKVAGLLRCIPTVQVEQVVYMEDNDDETLMDPLIHALQDPQLRVLINYHRGLAGQVGGGGHFSPVIAYHEKGRAVLVADVAKYKYPYVWIPIAKLQASMAGLDACGKRTNNHTMTTVPSFHSQSEMAAMLKELGCQPTPRGYIIVSAMSGNNDDLSLNNVTR